jgi:Na+:H+ antiporter, NhaA family
MSGSKQIFLVGYRDLKNKISRESSQTLRETLLKRYGEETIHFRYKYCPNLETNPSALNAAKAIVAAEHQSKSEIVYQALSGRNNYDKNYVYQVVKDLGLEMESFEWDFDSKATLDRINQDITDSKTCGLTVFPGLIIDDVPYNGAWDNDSLFSAIEKRGAQQVSVAIESFFHWGASAAAVLIFATVAALIMVNSGFDATYEHWKHTKIGFMFSGWDLILPLEVWINDFFMAIFFLLIGLEIKKEVIDGELSDIKRAAMPVIGAIGGMVIPALIYVVFNMGTETSNGWGIPMATDIAFTLGLMALLGSRVPLSLKIFISALAIADDLGAIIVIALFYGHGFELIPFLLALGVIGLMFFLNKKHVYNISIYVALGLVLWFLIYQSGLHATLAGVITAILIPNRRSADLPLIAEQTAIIFDREIEKIQDTGNDQKQMAHGSLQLLRNATERLREPSDDLIHSLEKVVNFVILPLFAFFNTGILLSGADVDLTAPISLGVILGLVLGKPLGIVGACWIASKANIAKLSSQINWKTLIGASALAGVGFTMSIVVASSAFHDEALTSSKISILIASTVAAVLGIMILRAVTSKKAV